MSYPGTIPATLAEVLAVIDQRLDLLPQKRRDLRSAVNSVARFAACPPGAVRLDIPELRRTLENVQPARFGFAARRFSNVRSLFVEALLMAGVPVEPLRIDVPVIPSWACLRDALPSVNERNLMARFMRSCTQLGIEPADVTDCTIAAYLESLELRSFVLRPQKHVQNLVRSWNQARETAACWPQTRLTPRRNRKIIMLPLSTFPERLVSSDQWAGLFRRRALQTAAR